MGRARWIIAVVTIVFVVYGPNVSAIEEDPRAGSAFYVDSFGLVDPAQFSLADRVESVFSKLLRVADRTRYKDPGLLLIESSNWPWAIALPDNNVVLSRGAVELCYRDVSVEQGDARLALILGHELGHLAEDDYWHRDVYLSLSNRAEGGADSVLNFIGERSGLVDTSSENWKTIVRDRELKADDRGFIYAALAGFDTRLLIEGERESFFHFWTEQTTNAPGDFHLSADDRAAYLRARAGSLSDVAELFQLGVALVHLGELSFAESVFRQVLTVFPAHEVYNNLGFIKLQQSLEKISLDVEEVFWMPASFDTAPETPALKTRSAALKSAALDPVDGLEEAAKLFTLSTRQHPGYIDGYLNLATANFYLKKYSNAAAVLAEARVIAQDPGSGQSKRLGEIEALWQIAMLHNLRGSVDYLPIAMVKLESISAAPDADPGTLFNLAQLYHLNGDDNRAHQTWQRLAAPEMVVAAPFDSVARYRLTGSVEAEPSNNTPVSPESLLGSMPVTVADSLTTELPVTLNNARLTRTGVAPGTDSGTREYRLSTTPVIRISQLPDGTPTTALERCCGTPMNRTNSTLGEIYSYEGGWAALVQNDSVREIWQSPGLAE